ncbi:3-phosphoglycerate dehydrogenase family protein [Aerococcus urinae]|uniref:3-phosphoglycerate dehydrogenase family protein n=1 Tax=Aerococcus urinae TaxID=1376 RepID=UPI0018A7E038|nr:3-phosphoglycerate dehydrogenase family protein [Aerococcus urinae]
MKKINTLDNIAETGLNYLRKQGYLINNDQDPDALILRSSDIHNYNFSSQLKAIGRSGVGVNNIPVDECSEKGIVVFNAPGANANSVKELVIAMMINLSRNVFQAEHWINRLEGEDVHKQVEAGKKMFRGQELMGKTLGVIGLGNVGARVANAGIELGMDVIGYDNYISVKNAWQINQKVSYCDDVKDIFQQADYITIHTPYTEETHHLIGFENLSLVKTGAIILNYSRQETVDPQVMLTFLENGMVKYFASDFYFEELAGREDFIMTPHLGASTEQSEEKCALMVAQEVNHYLESGEIKNSVNFPNVEMTFNAPLRLSIINENIPNMVAGISRYLADEDINIEKIINKSRGNYAYTLVDVSGDDLLSKVNTFMEDVMSVKGIKKIRMIQNPHSK